MEFLIPGLLVPILSAYILLILSLPTRYYVLRLSGQHLAFQLSAVGFFLFCVSIPIDHLIRDSTSDFLLPFKISGEYIYRMLEILNSVHTERNGDQINPSLHYASVCVVLSIAVPIFFLLLELFFGVFLRKFFDKSYASYFGGGAVILTELFYKREAVLVTLKSKKIYIGYILRLPHWGAHSKTITLYPLASGYRNEQCQMTLTNDYDELWSILAVLEKHPYNSTSLIIKNKRGKVIRSIPYETAIEMRDQAAITFRFDEIDTISQWLPDLYFIHTHRND